MGARVAVSYGRWTSAFVNKYPRKSKWFARLSFSYFLFYEVRNFFAAGGYIFSNGSVDVSYVCAGAMVRP